MKITTPVTGTPKPKTKGGPGVYDGEKGYPKRTSTPHGPPEKTRDKCGGKY